VMGEEWEIGELRVVTDGECRVVSKSEHAGSERKGVCGWGE
jgi:hypothetical protein